MARNRRSPESETIAVADVLALHSSATDALPTELRIQMGELPRPTAVWPCRSVGRASADLIRRSWVQIPPGSLPGGITPKFHITG